jgi:hypothetical protein
MNRSLMNLRQPCEDRSFEGRRIPVKRVTVWTLAEAQNPTQA